MTKTKCPDCLREVRLRKDGCMFVHAEPGERLNELRCPGSGWCPNALRVERVNHGLSPVVDRS